MLTIKTSTDNAAFAGDSKADVFAADHGEIARILYGHDDADTDWESIIPIRNRCTIRIGSDHITGWKTTIQ